MEEHDVKDFRRRAINYFVPVLVAEGYPPERAQNLAFFISLILEGSLPLLEHIEKGELDEEKVLQDIHGLFTNSYAFQEGNKILMWEDRLDENITV